MKNLATRNALVWWNGLADISVNSFSKSHFCEKYHGSNRIHRSLKDSEITQIFLQEIVNIKELDVFTLDNQTVTFTIAELKEFSEDFAKMVIDRGDDSNMTGFWDLCKKQFYQKFKQGL